MPLSRVGTVDDMAALLLFLASDESSFCTGTEFVIDGGMTAAAPSAVAADAPSSDPLAPVCGGECDQRSRSPPDPHPSPLPEGEGAGRHSERPP